MSLCIQVNIGAEGDQTMITASEQFWADDESDLLSGITSNFVGPQPSPRREENRCRRCGTRLQTMSRYCRNCYENRTSWMPSRPTKAKTQRFRRSIEPKSSASCKVAKDRWKGRSGTNKKNDQSKERWFTIGRRKERAESSSTESSKYYIPKRNGFLVFSNLPKRNRDFSPSMDSSCGSNFDVIQDREQARLRRRERMRGAMNHLVGFTSSENESEDEFPCLECGVRPRNTALIHNDRSSSHRCYCYECVIKLARRSNGLECPVCGHAVTAISTWAAGGEHNK